MKKLILVAFVLLLMAAMVVPAMASKSQQYKLAGTITGISKGNRTVTVSIACGQGAAKSYAGENVTLHVKKGASVLSIGKVGKKIKSSGNLINSVWKANSVSLVSKATCN